MFVRTSSTSWTPWSSPGRGGTSGSGTIPRTSRPPARTGPASRRGGRGHEAPVVLVAEHPVTGLGGAHVWPLAGMGITRTPRVSALIPSDENAAEAQGPTARGPEGPAAAGG